jgi:hypothetical protein
MPFNDLFAIVDSFPYLDEIGLEPAERDWASPPRHKIVNEKVFHFERGADNVKMVSAV